MEYKYIKSNNKKQYFNEKKSNKSRKSGHDKTN